MAVCINYSAYPDNDRGRGHWELSGEGELQIIRKAETSLAHLYSLLSVFAVPQRLALWVKLSEDDKLEYFSYLEKTTTKNKKQQQKTNKNKQTNNKTKKQQKKKKKKKKKQQQKTKKTKKQQQTNKQQQKKQQKQQQ